MFEFDKLWGVMGIQRCQPKPEALVNRHPVVFSVFVLQQLSRVPPAPFWSQPVGGTQHSHQPAFVQQQWGLLQVRVSEGFGIRVERLEAQTKSTKECVHQYWHFVSQRKGKHHHFSVSRSHTLRGMEGCLLVLHGAAAGWWCRSSR